ncbi:hypothetical protein [Porphyromonas somerae]|uniref:hypothetical protein n=1 Tax=Porphyromonas somerae TaxID=322095 RepID=UPI002A75FDEE|nr:hypothetical protein [Porphyromonas somerae]MDY3120689.1 hypothetical protein [Porphyromonas somerae]
MKRLSFLTLLFVVVMNFSCARNSETKHNDAILGRWELREVINGVKYYISFNPNQTITQVFVAPDGYKRIYSGRWSIDSDTLFMQDSRGDYKLLISEATDSTLMLIRQDSLAMICDRLSEKEYYIFEP